ncbi:hypothetical protein CRM84_18890 [Escherichia coli]|nr:hypothetical protein CRM84_18890 [Escherichia coli]
MVFIFRLATLRIRIFERPHRLSDKLLKSSCDAAFSSLSRGGVYYAFPLQSQAFIFAFSVGILRRTPLTRRRVCRCSVSVVAHYRELFRPDKRKFKIIFRPRNIQPNQPKTASFSSVSKP